MGKISEFIERRTGWAAGDERWWHDIGFGRSSNAGVNVNEATALRSTAVYACITLISDIMAELPKILFRRLEPRGRERAVNHPLYPLLHESPNPEMDAFTFDQIRMGHVLGWGNSYVEIDWDINTGRVRGLWPLRPDKMKVIRASAPYSQMFDDKNQGDLLYLYTTPDGIQHTLPAWRVWHMPGFGYDGIVGYSPISLAREAIGLGMAAEEFGARFYSQGSHMGLVASTPSVMTKQGSENLERSLNNQYAGLGKSHRIMVLEQGLKIEKIGINPNDAQFLETRKFQLNEICRFFRVLPHLIADTEKSTSWGTGIEQQNIGFLTYTIGPWNKRNELSGDLKLLGPEERKTYYIEALVDSLMRGDAAARATFYKELFYLGAVSPNDIREKENMNPIEDENGDKYFVQANMVPIDMAGQFKTVPKPGDLQNMHTLPEAVRKIAEREKQNILRAAKKNPEGFGTWLEDFYRDFPEYISRQVEPMLGDKAGEFAQRYIEQSRRSLAGIDVERIEAALGDWEERRCGEMKNE